MNQHYWNAMKKIIPGYAVRPEQVKLHKGIVGGMKTGRNIIGEGPCGTGKSMAYLMAHLCVGFGRTVVVTANNSMVGQLYHKDLPMVENCANLNHKSLDWTMIMGKSNYICPKKMNSMIEDGSLGSSTRLRGMQDYLVHLDCQRKHWLGHVSKLEYYETIKNMLTIPSGRCKGSKCEVAYNCEMFTARHHGKESSVVVTNYHIFIMDALMKRMGVPAESTMLGFYDRVVMDEVHELPEIAREYFALDLSDKWIEQIAKRVPATMRTNLRIAWRGYVGDFDKLGKTGYIERFPVRVGVAALMQTVLIDCYEVIASIEKKKDEDFRALEDVSRRVEICGDALAGSVSSRTHAYGYFNQDGNKTVKCVELNTGNLLKRLYPENIQISAVSATLAIHSKDGPNFAFMKRQLGLDDAEEIIVDSPFDFSKNIVHTMSDSPDPNSEGWVNYCASVIKSMILGLQGRTLALFTSSKRMRAVGEILTRDSDIAFPVIVQGDASNAALTEQFRDNPNVSLLGVNSFWTGIDVGGDSLSGVFIERIPFPTPDDLVSSALTAQDRNAFTGHLVPYATMRMKQGAGRLIRKVSDQGIVVVGDKRIVDKAYGKRVLKNILPGGIRIHGSRESLSRRCTGLLNVIKKRA